MQTRSKTLRQRSSKCFAEMHTLLTRISGKSMQRIQAIYAFLIYLDKNFTLVRQTLEKECVWVVMRDKVNKCKKDIESGNADLLMSLLSKKERNEMIRIVYELEKKF